MNYTEIERAAARHFHLVQQAQYRAARLTGELQLSMWATPAYRFNADGTGEFSCDAFTYHIYPEKGDYLCRVEINRVEAKTDSARPSKLQSLSCYPIQVMKPWSYAKGENPLAALGEYPELPEYGEGGTKALLEIRNLQNLIFEHRLHGIGELFSKDPGASLAIEPLGIDGPAEKALVQCEEILESERDNSHCYRFLGVTGMPVIEVSKDERSAGGLFLTVCYSVDAQSLTLRRSFALTRSEYVLEDGRWKILSMELRELVRLPDAPYSMNGRYDMCAQSDKPWPVDQTGGETPDSADAMEIENIINAWAFGCRRGTLPEFIDKYINNSEGRCRMWIKSRGDETPVQENYARIQEKITEMTTHYREEYYTFHAPTTPVLRQLSDGSIMGTWFDCAATNLRSAAKGPEAVPYMCFVNKYAHRFEKLDGAWKMVYFRNEPAISLPDWELDMVNNTGYLKHSPVRRFPAVFPEDEA